MDWRTIQFYAEHLGWPLFPCSNRTKAPLTPHGFYDATTDLRQLEAWDKAYPDAAWGTPTSAERGVIDIDPRNGGELSLNRLIAEYGPLPPTPTVRTGSGGFHYWFRFPPGTGCGKPYPGIDRKGIGGYVIVPPSRIDIPEHQGRAYAWEDGCKPWEGVPYAEAPAWSVRAEGHAAGSASCPASDADAFDPWVVRASGDDLLTHPGSSHGERRETFCRLAGIHLARGDSEASVRAMAEAWAMRCTPTFDGKPNPDDHWEKHLAGLLAREAAKAMKMTTPHAPLPYTVSVSIAEDRSDTILPPEGRKEGINSGADGEAELIPSFPASGEAEHGQDGELIPSFPPSAESGEASGLSAEWPTLSPEAEYGLFGEMLRSVKPYTEADPAGILLGWLCCFGNIVGRGAWVQVGPRKHHPALYVGVVGRTSDAKGDSWAVSLWPFREVEPEWASVCIANGVGSGEGLVERVADPQMDKDGVAQGATDKRCLLRLSELSRCFKLGRRENATLSEYLREAWDGEPIHVPNRKKNGNALSATDYAVSLIGDITPGVLRKLLEGGTEAFDGWANRFLWAAVKRSRFLPDGGSMEPLKLYLDRLKSALAYAKQAGEVKRDAEAETLWESVYPSLCTSGDTVPHTDRARAYAVRLSMLYALADCSAEIRLNHLRAALALWDYCRASARLIFGTGQGPTPGAKPDDPVPVRVLNAIGKAPGVSRSDLLRAFREASAEELDAILTYAERSGMAHKRMVQPEGGGRPAECWYPGPEGEAEGVSDDNPAALPPDETASASAESVGRKEITPSLVADGESVGKERKEGNNSPLPVVNSFLPKPEAEADAQGQGDEGREATGVVNEKPDALPRERPAQPLPERQPGESDDDYFMRRLELA